MNCIGKGGFGHVFDARRKSDDTLVVMKFLPRNRILNWGTVQGVSSLVFVRSTYSIAFLLETSSIRNWSSSYFTWCPWNHTNFWSLWRTGSFYFYNGKNSSFIDIVRFRDGKFTVGQYRTASTSLSTDRSFKCDVTTLRCLASWL